MQAVGYNQAHHLLEEADVLLFRGKGWMSKAIQVGSQGKYSHAAVASKHQTNGHFVWEAVEFREWKGGRTVSLKNYVEENDGIIDVFRAPATTNRVLFKNGSVETQVVHLDRKAITNKMRSLTGLPYGWRRIWWMTAQKLPFLRWIPWINRIESRSDDDDHELVYPVCSTAVAHCYSSTNYDLVHQRSDNATEPSDLARSAKLNYLFTLKST